MINMELSILTAQEQVTNTNRIKTRNEKSSIDPKFRLDKESDEAGDGNCANWMQAVDISAVFQVLLRLGWRRICRKYFGLIPYTANYYWKWEGV